MANLGVHVVIKAVDKMTAPLRPLQKATERFSLSVKGSEKRLNKLQSQLKQVKHLKHLKTELGKTSHAFGQSQIKLKQLSEKMRASTQANQVLKDQFQATKQASESLASKLANQRQTLGDLSKSLHRAGVNTKHLQQAEAQLAQKINQTTHHLERQQIVSASLNRVTTRFSQMRKAIGKTAREAGLLTAKLAAIGGLAGWSFKRQFIDTAAQFERFQTILLTTEGSSEKAKKSMDWISAFASKTPYELSKVTDAFVKLRGYGLDPTKGLLQSIGDASSGMGKDLNQVVEAMADAVVGESERLKDLSITTKTVGNEIQYMYTNKQGIGKTLTANKDDRAGIQAVIQKIFNEKYGSSMMRQSKTWSGMLSNLSDHWYQFKLSIMNAKAFDLLKKKLRGILDHLDHLKKSGELEKIAERVGKQLMHCLQALWRLGQQVTTILSNIYQITQRLLAPLGGVKALFVGLAGLLAGKMIMSVFLLGKAMVILAVDSAALCYKMIAVFAGVGASLKSVMLGIRAVSVAMLTTPLGLFMTAVIGATMAVIKYWDRVKAFFSGIKAGFSSVAPELANLIDAVKTPFVALGNLVAWVGSLIGKLISPSKATTQQLKSATHAGLAFGRMLGKSCAWVSKLIWGIAERITKITRAFQAFHLFGSKAKLTDLNKTIHHQVNARQLASQRMQPAHLMPPSAKTTVNHTSHITIHQQAGEDSEALARRIAQAEIKAQQDAKAAQTRSLLYDYQGAML